MNAILSHHRQHWLAPTLVVGVLSFIEGRFCLAPKPASGLSLYLAPLPVPIPRGFTWGLGLLPGCLALPPVGRAPLFRTTTYTLRTTNHLSASGGFIRGFFLTFYLRHTSPPSPISIANMSPLFLCLYKAFIMFLFHTLSFAYHCGRILSNWGTIALLSQIRQRYHLALIVLILPEIPAVDSSSFYYRISCP